MDICHLLSLCTLATYVLFTQRIKPSIVTCGIDKCTEVFGAFAALNSHIYRHHRVALGLERAPVVDTGNEAEADQANPVFVPDDEPPDFMNSPKFLLHMRDRQVSQVANADIIVGLN